MVSIFRCSVASVLVCSTGLVVGGRLTPFFAAANMPTAAAQAMRPVKELAYNGVQMRERTSGLHSRRLLAAGTPAQPIDVSPPWTVPTLGQMATDPGHSLATATTFLGSQPLTTPAGQSSAAVTNTQDTSQVTTADDLDLPVATQGTEQWAGVVAKAMTAGGMSHSDSLQALQSFKTAVAAKMATTAETLAKLQKGDVSGFVEQVMSKAVAITPPVFFSSNTNLFQDSVSATNFGFTGVGVSPCAIAVTPVGIGIGAPGINIAPQGISIAPTGVNVAPQGASIGPTLIALGPYDTTVAPQGLNIASALISVAPVKTIINPTGPLSISGKSVVQATVPALPSSP